MGRGQTITGSQALMPMGFFVASYGHASAQASQAYASAMAQGGYGRAYAVTNGSSFVLVSEGSGAAGMMNGAVWAQAGGSRAIAYNGNYWR
ncbi:hypothetical protein ABW19_dt0204844 [Dactylella cylindrospora]|nr:hypothetical protein ABW19_dt0204844 [Dactylella cylindrospora]